MTSMENHHWSISSRIYLRFIFLYLVFYIYPYGFEYIKELNTSDISFWQDITIWFGEFFLGWEFDSERLLNGFDSKYDYSRFLLITLLSVFGTAIWMFIDSKFRSEYNVKLEVLTRTILRYHVGLTLILYGLAKVFMLQFGEMDLDKLGNPMGNHTGMRFLWAFMSYSKFYTMCTGWIEVIGGVLLLFRRSTFMGAFILFIAMTNVVLLDIGYDVRVKMFAIHLFLMTILLMDTDIKRIFNFFVFNKPTKPSINEPLLSEGAFKKIGYFIKGVLLLYFTISFFINFNDRIQSRTANKYPSMTRFHKVEIQVLNGDTIPESDGHRWKSVSINGNSRLPESLKIILMDHKESLYSFTGIYSFKADTIKKTMEFHPFRGSESDISKFQYKELEDGTFVFEGSHQEDCIWIKTRAKTLKDYPLKANDIRWITDSE